jgi:hypothetical protein
VIHWEENVSNFSIAGSACSRGAEVYSIRKMLGLCRLRAKFLVDDDFLAATETLRENQQLRSRCKSAPTLWQVWRAPRWNAPAAAGTLWA